jgi:glycosyltransferase involved in cell wall biosynthesis
VKIVFFNRFFYPDTSATSQILSDLAFHLASAGFTVHVVTSAVDGDSREEMISGVCVHRVAKASTGPHGLIHRAFAYARYYMGAKTLARRLVQAGDVVVIKTDPPLLAQAMAKQVTSRGAKLVLWLQDLFPEVAKAYGVPGLQGWLHTWLQRSRNRTLARADAVVPIADSMARRLGHALDESRTHVIHNWADGSAISPPSASAETVRDAWGLRERFVVEYSGNFGRVHEFDTILDAARILQAESGIAFVMVGRGPRLADAQRKAEDLSNVSFEDHQPRDMLPKVLATADVHLSVLRPEFEGLVHPSKMYGILAAGKPTIFVGDAKGESARMLAEADCGLSVESGDAAGLARAIRLMRDEPARTDAMGRNARRAFDEKFDRGIAFARWVALLQSLGARPHG